MSFHRPGFWQHYWVRGVMDPQKGLGAKVKFQGNMFTVAEYNILRTCKVGAAERMLCMKSSVVGLTGVCAPEEGV